MPSELPVADNLKSQVSQLQLVTGKATLVARLSVGTLADVAYRHS